MRDACSGVAQDRHRWRKLVSAVMNLRVPWNAGNFLTSCKTVSFSRRTLHYGVSKYWEACPSFWMRLFYRSTSFSKFYEPAPSSSPQFFQNSVNQLEVPVHKFSKILWATSKFRSTIFPKFYEPAPSSGPQFFKNSLSQLQVPVRQEVDMKQFLRRRPGSMEWPANLTLNWRIMLGARAQIHISVMQGTKLQKLWRKYSTPPYKI